MSAILGTFADARAVKGRSVFQIIVEVPLENADKALQALGGWPQPATERWVGVALAPKEHPAEPSKAKRAWADLRPTEQAGIRCSDNEFSRFLQEAYSEYEVKGLEANTVRMICAVDSRKNLNTDEYSAARWKALDAQFLEWQTTQRYEQSRTK